MKILIAINAFKGSLSALEASQVTECAIKSFSEEFNPEILITPIADGGTGSLEVWNYFLGLPLYFVDSVDALGNYIKGAFLYDSINKRAYLEMAQTSGVHLIKPSPKTLGKANTYGVGLVLMEALRLGAEEIYIGIGGSATHDLGTGVLRACGVKFLDKNSKQLKTPNELKRFTSIDFSEMSPLFDSVKLKILCDVDNTLLGLQGAAYVYARQKGAFTDFHIEKCEDLSRRFVEYFAEHNIQIGGLPGDGAAGGFASILRHFTNTEMLSGMDFLEQLSNIKEKIEAVDLIITGEGRFDKQSYYGKGPGYIVREAESKGRPVLIFTGLKSKDEVTVSQSSEIICINPENLTHAEALERADRNLYEAVRKALRSRLHEKSVN